MCCTCYKGNVCDGVRFGCEQLVKIRGGGGRGRVGIPTTITLHTPNHHITNIFCYYTIISIQNNLISCNVTVNKLENISGTLLIKPMELM